MKNLNSINKMINIVKISSAKLKKIKKTTLMKKNKRLLEEGIYFNLVCFTNNI